MFATLLVADDGSAPGIAAGRVGAYLAAVTGARVVTEASSTPHALHRAARAAEADVLVAPATPRPESLVHGSPCAVVLVPPACPAPRFARVGVACDATASSRAAVAAARELAALPDSPIRQLDLVLVEPAGRRRHRAEPSPAAVWLDHVAGEPAGRARVRAVHATGDAGDALVERAERWDLMLMGSRSRGPVRSLLLGSTSAWVARRVGCPVLVVPRVPHVEPATRGRSPFEARVADALRGNR